MSDPKIDSGPAPDLESMSEHDLLMLLDLAAEVIEGLDQLGVTNREEVEALINRIEMLIGDED